MQRLSFLLKSNVTLNSIKIDSIMGTYLEISFYFYNSFSSELAERPVFVIYSKTDWFVDYIGLDMFDVWKKIMNKHTLLSLILLGSYCMKSRISLKFLKMRGGVFLGDSLVIIKSDWGTFFVEIGKWSTPTIKVWRAWLLKVTSTTKLFFAIK